MNNPPSIGITVSWVPHQDDRTGFSDTPFDFNKSEYSEAIARSGGLPILIPNLLSEHWDLIDPLLIKIDGLCLSGGSDLAPDLFGQEEIPDAGCLIRRRRDEFELELLRRWDILRPDGPIFAICRGHQVLNIHYGGTLIQDFDACSVETIPQGHRTPDRKRTVHWIKVEDGTLLADIIGEGFHLVNSSHHQGIDRLGEGFIPGAFAPDGIIEGFELKSKSRWLISVQWHPEAMMFAEDSRRLFEAFVDACKC